MDKKRLFACLLIGVLFCGILMCFPLVHAAVLFYDDFETGNMSGWSFVHNVVVTSNPIAVHSGTYGANCTWSDGDWAGAGYVLPSPQTTIYFLEWIKLASLPHDHIQSFGYMSENVGGGGNDYHCDLYNDSGVWHWWFCHGNTSSELNANVTAGVWWSLQIGVTPTWCAFWINGIMQENDTGTFFPVMEPFMGMAHYESGNYTHTVYIDDVYISTTNLFAQAAPVQASINSMPASIDVGQSVAFTSTINGGVPPYSFQWYLNNTAVSGATNSTWVFTPSFSGSYNVYANVTTSLGLTTKSNIVTVTVNPALSVHVSPTSATMDIDQSQTFTSNVSGGISPFNYQWYLNGVPEGTNSSWTFAPGSSGSYSVYVNVTDNVGRKVQSDVATIAVNTAPYVTISPLSWTMDVGQSTIFTAKASGGSGSYSSYQWYVDGQLQSDQASTFVYSSSAGPLGAHSITVTITDSLGVTSPQSSPAKVMVDAALVAPTVIASASTVDQYETSVLSNSTVISTGTPSYSYEWFEMTPGASVYSAIHGATSTGYSFVTSVSTATGVWHFELNVTDATGVVVTSDAVTVTVDSVLVAPTVMASPGMVDQGQSSSLTSPGVTTGTSPYSYQWFQEAPGGSYATVGGNTSSYTFSTTGSTATGSWNFILQVTDHTGAAVNSTAVSVMVSARGLIHEVAAVNIRPSKTVVVEGQSINVNITVENEGNYTEAFNVTLYESLGGYSQPIYTFIGVALVPGSTTTLTVTWLRVGVGFYTLSAHVYNAYFNNTYAGATVWVMPFESLELLRPWFLLYTGGGWCGARFWHPAIPF
jgi:hypothetical protein